MATDQGAKVSTDALEKVRARAYAIRERLGRPGGAAEGHGS